MYYFIELAGSITNIALLSLFMSRLFVRNKIQSKWHYTFLTLLCTGQCVLSLFPNWVIPRTLYLLLGGFLLARLFYEVQTWPAAFASGSFFVLGSVVEILAMLLLSVVIGNTFDNAIEACRLIAPEKRVIHLQLRKQNRILFYSIENPYIDAVTQLRVGKHHGYGLKNVERAVNQNNGNFQVEKVDGNFIVQIRLNCEN